LDAYDSVLSTHVAKTKENAKISKELSLIVTTLKLSKSLKSNKDISYRILAQIASSVPKRVKFNSVDYNGKDQVIIKGIAASDQDILKLISNLSSKKLINQASLGSMSLPKSRAGGVIQKGFKIFVNVNKG
jgi:type IV pilus assembly protein PilN